MTDGPFELGRAPAWIHPPAEAAQRLPARNHRERKGLASKLTSTGGGPRRSGTDRTHVTAAAGSSRLLQPFLSEAGLQSHSMRRCEPRCRVSTQPKDLSRRRSPSRSRDQGSRGVADVSKSVDRSRESRPTSSASTRGDCDREAAEYSYGPNVGSGERRLSTVRDRAGIMAACRQRLVQCRTAGFT